MASVVFAAVTIAPENSKSRPKEVARVLVIIDHQDVNSPQFVGRSTHSAESVGRVCRIGLSRATAAYL